MGIERLAMVKCIEFYHASLFSSFHVVSTHQEEAFFTVLYSKTPDQECIRISVKQ